MTQAGQGLHQLVYVSRSPRPVVSAMQMGDILNTARVNNLRDGITGALTAVGDRFVQILEGSPAALDDLLRRLDQDDRHFDLVVLERRAPAARAFPAWDMVSPRLMAEDLAGLSALFQSGAGELDAFIAILSAAVARQDELLTARARA